ncbi:unnamed protein product [Urochloa humidicola]
MGYRVTVLNTTHVLPAHTTRRSRSRQRHADHKLSFLDVIHAAVIPIQRLFFFDGPDLPPFPSVVSTLQTSLAATLAIFMPLAGSLAYRRSSGDVVIDCSMAAVSSGVMFIEAEFSGSDCDMRHLASDDEHDTETFMQLVPEIDVRQLPARILAVQVTRPAVGVGNGPVAVGVSILHAAVDGQAVWQFMRAWSTASRLGSISAPGLQVMPTFDREAVRHPKSQELCRTFLRFFAPALPLLRPTSSSSALDSAQQRRRTFQLIKEQIQSLKRRVPQSSSVSSGYTLPAPPTTYVAVSSLVWTSIVRAKSLDHADVAHFMVTADCRHRLNPPLGEGFFGNCIKPCFAAANVGDLCGEDGLAHAAAAIQRCIRESLVEMEDPLSDIARSMEVYLAISKGRRLLTVVGSSHRFKAYETDFGWADPAVWSWCPCSPRRWWRC